MTILLALILAPAILLTLCFAAELLFGIWPLSTRLDGSSHPHEAVIVVPAHDEELVIGATLSKLTKAAAGHARILVVADNCTDSTAVTARKFGVAVIERFDPERRGKSFALHAAKEALRSDPPDILVVLDADCSIDSASLQRLIEQCAASERPCQAQYVQVPAPDAPPTVQLSTFAFFVRNVIRQRALQRLARRVHLVGTGMAFPWLLFERAALANDNIVEDLELGLELAEQGVGAVLVEDATVASNAASAGNTLDQRRRWEGGYLQSARRWGPKLLIGAVRHGDPHELWAAMSMFVPPFALLLLADVCLLIVAAAVTLAAGLGMLPVFVLAGAIGLALFGLILAWAAGGSRFVGLTGLAQAPFYVLGKVPLYVGLARRGAPRQWVRTGRE